MMAGDVTAQIVNGNLLIKGDNSDNVIAVTQAGTTITVTGTGTTVNSAATPAVLTGFTGGITMKMRDGNDQVTLTALTVAGKVKFKGGDGDDTLHVTGTSAFQSSFKINMGSGDDTVTLDTGLTVTGATKIKGRSGTDTVTMTGDHFSTLKVSLGRDDDTLSITGTTVTTKTRLHGGGGTNTFTNGAGNSLADLEVDDFDQV